jgi:hypothetical protein
MNAQQQERSLATLNMLHQIAFNIAHQPVPKDLEGFLQPGMKSNTNPGALQWNFWQQLYVFIFGLWSRYTGREFTIQSQLKVLLVHSKAKMQFIWKAQKILGIQDG